MTITGPDADLLGAVGALRDSVAAPRLPLAADGAASTRRIQADLIRRLDDYLIPRLRCPDGPVHIVVGGSTGVGKSTLVNSLLRQEVSKAGVLRPTTRSAVLCVNPADIAAVTGPERLLPAFLRAPGQTERPDAFTLVPHPAIPAGVALIDTPDVNSVVAANRDAGERLLGAADAWLLVTTAERYADAVPWRLLQAARERRVTVAIVLNRVPPESLREVREAGQALLAVNGLGDLPLFTVPESVLTGGLLPEYLLDPLMTWLRLTAHDPTMRQATISATVNGMFDDLPRRLGAVADGLMAQAEAAEQLRVQADLAYSAERAGLHDAIAQGELLRGTPLLEWQTLIASDRAAALFTPGDPAAATARRLLLGAAADQVAAAASRAADQVAAAWRQALTEADESEAQVSAGTRAGAVPPELDEWADGLVDLVAREPHHKRSDAQFFAAGQHGPAALLTAVVFTGRRGAAPKRRRALRVSPEPVHPAAAATRRLADAVFGADETDRLAELAAASLDTALGALFDRLAFRHHRALMDLGVESGAGKALLEAGEAVQRAR
ncbi:GTPase domain-containing protein [Actinocrinis sp.]|uniref:GTPase domain-containing protein n=1 Tax=Actinocrinis sp. TaxID=1920516 RepID=UPI002DDD738B|nr:GTPase domain-containing protein [Actinocrinis sp.]